MRSTANVDVARGADVVVVLAPLPQAFSRATSIAAQLRRIGPVRSVVVKPDKQAALDIGRNVLDPDQARRRGPHRPAPVPRGRRAGPGRLAALTGQAPSTSFSSRARSAGSRWALPRSPTYRSPYAASSASSRRRTAPGG